MTISAQSLAMWDYSETGSQDVISNVLLNGGGWVTTWQSSEEALENTALYQQAFDADGNPVGDAVLLAEDTPDGVVAQTLALEEGRWAQVWLQDGVVKMQTFNADGTAAGDIVDVSSVGGREDFAESDAEATTFVAGVVNDVLVIVWNEYELWDGNPRRTQTFHQAYASDGSPIGSEALLLQQTGEIQGSLEGFVFIASTPLGAWQVGIASELHEADNEYVQYFTITWTVWDDAGNRSEEFSSAYSPGMSAMDQTLLLSNGNVLYFLSTPDVFGLYDHQVDVSGPNGSSNVAGFINIFEGAPTAQAVELSDGGFAYAMIGTDHDFWMEVDDTYVPVGPTQIIYSKSFDANGSQRFAQSDPETSHAIPDTADPASLGMYVKPDAAFMVHWVSDDDDGTFSITFADIDGEGRLARPEYALTTTSDTVPDFKIMGRDNGSWTVTWFTVEDGQTTFHLSEYANDGTVLIDDASFSSASLEDVDSIFECQRLADDSWLITWTTADSDETSGQIRYFQQVLSPTGEAIGEVIEIVVDTTDDAGLFVLALPEGGWANVWQSNDSDGSGMQRQVYHLENTRPLLREVSVNVIPDADFLFDPTMFQFEDPDGHDVQYITITALPNSGRLTVRGDEVQVGDVIAYADLQHLVWDPQDTRASASPATLRFTITDDGGTAIGANTSLESTLTLNVLQIGIDGTDDADTLDGNAADNDIDAKDGDDLISPGLGVDSIATGGGRDITQGNLEELVGDTFLDLEGGDEIRVLDFQLGRIDVSITSEMTSVSLFTYFEGEHAGDLTFTNDLSGHGIFASFDGTDTWISILSPLPDLSDKATLDAEQINGVEGQRILTGADNKSFSISLLYTETGAQFNNMVGIYEIDESGNILNVDIMFDNANADFEEDEDLSNYYSNYDLEAGHEIGFFIIQNGYAVLGDTSSSDAFEFVNDNGDPANVSDGNAVMLQVNGANVTAPVYHSYDESLNPKGLVRAVSGFGYENQGGQQSIVIGFEDTTNGGDLDYEDVLLHVAIYIEVL